MKAIEQYFQVVLFTDFTIRHEKVVIVLTFSCTSVNEISSVCAFKSVKAIERNFQFVYTWMLDAWINGLDAK